MSNQFAGTGITYFQIPHAIVTGDTLSTLKGSSLRLYLLILSEAQRRSKPTVELTVAQIVEATGLARRHVDAAAIQLRELRLVDMIRHKGSRWVYAFDLLDPATGLSIPSQYDLNKLSAGNLTKAQIESYFLHRLGERFVRFDANGIEAWCPFHSKTTTKPTFTVKTSGGSAAWRCFDPECFYHGGGSILDFEQALQRERGQEISGTVAWERIRFIIRGAERKEAIQQGVIDSIQACAVGDADELYWLVSSERCYFL